MDIVMGLVIGIGLAAACGFRVFIPLLGMSIATMSGHLQPSAGFEWVGTWPALIAFATATTLEVGGYYVPWIDNLLDTAATPAAMIAGTLVTLSLVGDLSPMLRWVVAAIAGGGVSGVVQTGTVAIRAASLGTTAGLGNPVVSTIEWTASAAMTLLALILPIVSLVAVLLIVGLLVRAIWLSRNPKDLHASPDVS